MAITAGNKEFSEGWAPLFSSGHLHVLCVVLLCVAAVLRFSHLGDADFGLDEILHLHVAEQLLQGNPPALPSGFIYDRGLPFSYLVALAGSMGGFNEYTLRIPSAILGVLIILLVYWITTRWFSASAGLCAAFLTTFSPIEVAMSREVRMYTLFQILFLFLLFFFYEGFETSPPINRNKRLRYPHLAQWISALNIRPAFLVLAGIFSLLAWEVHRLIQTAVSGVIVYLFLMGVIALGVRKMNLSIRLKYIGTCLLMLIGALGVFLFFPQKIEELISVTSIAPAWKVDQAYNWHYYRWLLLDEYPLIFGGLTILLLFGLTKQPQLVLFISLSLLVPIIMHSAVFPQKSYRYILHVLPLMYMLAGVGFSELFSFLWKEGLKLNIGGYIPPKMWPLVVSGVLGVGMLGMLINMPWFMRTVKDYANGFNAPHVSDVQHHNWKTAMTYISQHQKEGEVIISGYPLLSRYYGATQPLYFMNDSYKINNIGYNLRNEDGQLIDYTSGSVVLLTLDEFMKVVNSHPSGWAVTYRWRDERFWEKPSQPGSLSGSFPDEVIRYLQDNHNWEEVPGAPHMALWRWRRDPVSSS